MEQKLRHNGIIGKEKKKKTKKNTAEAEQAGKLPDSMQQCLMGNESARLLAGTWLHKLALSLEAMQP